MAISLFLAYFIRLFCYHSNGKSKIKPGYYTWIILLINQLDGIGETQLSVLGSKRGQNLPLNARSSLLCVFLMGWHSKAYHY